MSNVVLSYSVTASRGILKAIGLIATRTSTSGPSAQEGDCSLPNEDSYETYGTIALGRVSELFRFASGYWHVNRAFTLRHKRTFSDDFQIVLLPDDASANKGESFPDEGSDKISDMRSRGLFFAYLNRPEFKNDVVKTLSKIRLSMSILRFAVIGIRKDFYQWIISANDRGSLNPIVTDTGRWPGAPDGATELPFICAPLTDEDCVLYYAKEKRTGMWRYIYRSKSETFQKLYDFHICHDPFSVDFEPQPDYSAIPGGFDILGMSRNPDAQTFHVPSVFFQLREKAMYMEEAKCYYYTAKSNNAHDRNIWGQRPLKDIAPEILAAESLAHSHTVTSASDKERQTTSFSAFVTGMIFANEVNNIGKSAKDTPDQLKRLATMREFDRYDTSGDPDYKPQDWALLKAANPTCDIDLAALEDSLLESIAQIFDVPFSHLKSTFESSSGRKLAAEDADPIKEHEEQTTKQERSLMDYIFNWIYQRTFARCDMHFLAASLATYNELELKAVENAFSASGRRAKLTRTDRRQLLYDALGGTEKKVEESKTKKGAPKKTATNGKNARGKKRTRSERNQEDGEVSSDDERADETADSTGRDEESKHMKALRTIPTGPTTTELRELIIAKLINRDRMVAHLIFDADWRKEMETLKLRDHELLEDGVRDSRLEEAKLIPAYFSAGMASSESSIKQVNEMFGWKLQPQGSNDLPRMGAEADAAAKRMKKKAKK